MVSSNTVFSVSLKFKHNAVLAMKTALLSIGECISATLRVEINFSERFIEL